MISKLTRSQSRLNQPQPQQSFWPQMTRSSMTSAFLDDEICGETEQAALRKVNTGHILYQEFVHEYSLG